MTRGSSEALLLLADGRLPAGGYAHSGGLESAVRMGLVSDTADLERFLAGRATTTAAVAASFAAAACHACRTDETKRLTELDVEFDARTPSPALRQVSRALGRQLLRAWAAIRPHEMQGRIPSRLHQPVAFGAAAAMLDLTPEDAARGLLHETLMSPAMAVVKVMSVDPFHAHRALATIIPLIDEVAEEAANGATANPADLPSHSAPLSDIAAEHHAAQEVRLFAS